MTRNNDMEESSVVKVYLKPGDLVQLKHDMPYKPKMLIVEKVTETNSKEISFLGMKCVWFNQNRDMCEGVFSTKDLEKV